MDESNKKTEYENLLKFINDLKNKLNTQIDYIDSIYNDMGTDCSIDDIPLNGSKMLDVKNKLKNNIEFIDSNILEEISEKLNSF